MGLEFNAVYLNLYAYLTIPTAEAPRAYEVFLYDFLVNLALPRHDSIREARGSSEWASSLTQAARKAMDLVSRERKENWPHHYMDTPIVPAASVARILAPLKEAIGTYRLYAILLGMEGQSDGLAALINSEQALVLLPRINGEWHPDRAFYYRVPALDALPPVTATLSRYGGAPGALFWTLSGSAAFVRPGELPDVERRLATALQEEKRKDAPDPVDDVLNGLSSTGTRILHISDLHLGTACASMNGPLLQVELHTAVKKTDHIVITGDLFNTPDEKLANDFTTFRQGLALVSGLDPIVIPGNHDQRNLGTIFSNFEHITGLPHQDVTVFHNTRTVFLSFNSSIKGRWAGGRITKAQRVRVAAELKLAMTKTPEVASYMKVALLHHHPISFKTKPSTWVQKGLSLVGIDDETFLKFEDSLSFLDWCARWDVSLIMHGHKHVPRQNEIDLTVDGQVRRITSVGCGSSLGAEGSPCSYDIVTLDPVTNTWSVRFLTSYDGGPFNVERITVARTAATGAPLANAS